MAAPARRPRTVKKRTRGSPSWQRGRPQDYGRLAISPSVRMTSRKTISSRFFYLASTRRWRFAQQRRRRHSQSAALRAEYRAPQIHQLGFQALRKQLRHDPSERRRRRVHQRRHSSSDRRTALRHGISRPRTRDLAVHRSQHRSDPARPTRLQLSREIPRQQGLRRSWLSTLLRARPLFL